MLLNLIKTLQGWKKSLLIISLVPILLFGFSIISSGLVFNPFFNESTSSLEFFKLPNLFSLFDSDIALPTALKIIGRSCAFSLNIIFLAWLILFTIKCYLELSRQIGNKIEFVIELIILSLIYFYFISPSSIVFFLLGLLLIVINFGLVILYWIYELKSKK